LNKISKSKDMRGMADHLLDVEKAWLLSQIGMSSSYLADSMMANGSFSFLQVSSLIVMTMLWMRYADH